METETKTSRPTTLDAPEGWEARAGYLTALRVHYTDEHQTWGIHLTRSELQAIVQAAYDQYGILAQPFITPSDSEAPNSDAFFGADQ